MEKRDYWLQKIVQLLHDPPGKPYFFRPGSGGHNKLAAKIHAIILAAEKPSRRRLADLLATGADRPVLNLPWGIKGNTGIQYFHKDPTVTHPLEHFPLKLNHPADAEEITAEKIDEMVDAQLDAAAISSIQPTSGADSSAWQQSWLMLWRRMREDIIAASAARSSADDSFLWQLMPADSRCPDHSIWEHNRLTSALAFVPTGLKKGHDQDADFPWLFSFALRPVQEFLDQARKSQDLWTGSMLLSELCWGAIEPIINHYGPDVIIYPDLRGNPRCDLWLYDRARDSLPENRENIVTRAAVIPHTFVAILPRGSKKSGHLQSLEEIGALACDGVRKKWQVLTTRVRDWMEKEIKQGRQDHGSSWETLWQHASDQCPVEPTWVAQPWVALEKQKTYFFPGHCLPTQDNIPEPGPEDSLVISERYRKLGQWMDESTWNQYEYALSVFARTHENYLLSSGFSYAPGHHKLRVRHGLRRRITTLPDNTPEDISFEKCSLCHRRAALGNEKFGAQKGSHIESIRQQVRTLWQNEQFSPDGSGSERLCAVCATKRFLVRSDSGATKANSFNMVWIGSERTLRDIQDSPDKTVRTPFPSTVQIAAQDFLVALASHSDELEKEMKAVIDRHKSLKLPFTSFPASLPRFAGSVNNEQLDNDFFKLDPQLSLFPEMVESKITYEKTGNIKNWTALLEAVKNLRKQCARLKIASPSTQLAVISMDGDKMGDLLLGKSGRIKTRWEDIIHPTVVEKIRKRFPKYGWPQLLSLQRLTGPSLQAFISRALADFSHTIVPWVVEQEFGGRLIYSGGDDLLALAPAGHALDMANRLQKLFSSAWIIDTRPDIRPWQWLENNSSLTWDRQKARKRFIILKENKPMQKGRLLPMLGKSGSLSAGIMYGHFKTSLGLLRRSSHDLLEEWAKEKSGRNSAGLGHFSRSGVKTMFAARWNCGGELAESMGIIIHGFGKHGKLPGSLPYKLKDYLEKLDPYLLDGGTDTESREEHRKNLMTGLLHKALDGERIDTDLENAVLAVWQAGYRLNSDKRTPRYCLRSKTGDQVLDGLLLCRYLATRTKGNQP